MVILLKSLIQKGTLYFWLPKKGPYLIFAKIDLQLWLLNCLKMHGIFAKGDAFAKFGNFSAV